MYARGMTVREIQAFSQEQYGTEVSPEFINSVTDAVLDELLAWQRHPLEPVHPVVFFDPLRIKIRAGGLVRNMAVYLPLGVLPDRSRNILGLWIENTERAKFWMKIFNDLKRRGVHDVLTPVTDGLQGMKQAGRGFPQDDLADLHRAFDPQQSGLRDEEGPLCAGCRTQASVRGAKRQGLSGRTRRVR